VMMARTWIMDAASSIICCDSPEGSPWPEWARHCRFSILG
jgi:hypothetical protein